MHCMIMNYFTFCSHLTNLRIHGMNESKYVYVYARAYVCMYVCKISVT